MEDIKKQKRHKRHQRIRAKIAGSAKKPRLAIFRSHQHIYGQLIDDTKGKTLLSASDLELAKKSKGEAQKTKTSKKSDGKIMMAQAAGKLLAEKSLAKGVKKIVFDRGGYKYHGRVKALADGAREGGLQF